MAINTIQFAALLQQKLDEQVTAQSTSGWMEANAGQVKYNGGKEIKVPSISTSGLADYNRDSGYVQGSVTSSYETFTMTQDRGRKFSIDAMDVDESGFIVNATSVIGEFQRDNVIPEIDAYRYSKIYALAKANSRVATAYDPVKATLLDALRVDIAAIQDIVGDGTPLVITMAQTVASVLDAVSDISKHITVSDFKQGGVNLKDSWCTIEDGELWVKGMHISPYEHGNIFNRDPMRVRRLLIHKKEINKLFGTIKQEGLTLIPISLYFKGSRVKMQVGLCKGKKLHDKRDAMAAEAAKRDIDRAIKERNR